MNRALEELGNQLIRQADSSGILPGTSEFDMMIKTRMITPENRMTNHLHENGKTDYKGSLREDIVIPSMEERYMKYIYLKDLVKWGKRNKGLRMATAARILNIRGSNTEDSGVPPMDLLIQYGERCEKFGLPNFTQYLDGTDDRIDEGATALPDELNSGNRMVRSYKPPS